MISAGRAQETNLDSESESGSEFDSESELSGEEPIPQPDISTVGQHVNSKPDDRVILREKPNAPQVVVVLK